ncbi:MAG TPA: YraN family protein [Candidatus Limnocylindria bacterium]|nr:YraN family protein [Candidatus Limnocylindria bacterium]
MHIKTQLGRYGEDLVSTFLEKKGFTILARNYAKRGGEIDLIARNREFLLFIEVKTRNKAFFDLSEVIVPSKQRKIIMVAKDFMARYGDDTTICRFDVALIDTSQPTPLTYIEDAFQESY